MSNQNAYIITNMSTETTVIRIFPFLETTTLTRQIKTNAT